MLHLGSAVTRLVLLYVLFFSWFGVGGRGLVFDYKRAWDPRWIVYCATHTISHPVIGLLVLCSCWRQISRMISRVGLDMILSCSNGKVSIHLNA